jgi:hypothetical protein
VYNKLLLGAGVHFIGEKPTKQAKTEGGKGTEMCGEGEWRNMAMR